MSFIIFVTLFFAAAVLLAVLVVFVVIIYDLAAVREFSLKCNLNRDFAKFVLFTQVQCSFTTIIFELIIITVKCRTVIVYI